MVDISILPQEAFYFNVYFLGFSSKRIELLFSKQNDNRIIICKNTVKESVLKNNPDLRSTKTTGDSHGWGHQIVEKIVSDYHGMIDYFEEFGMFGVQIIIPVIESE